MMGPIEVLPGSADSPPTFSDAAAARSAPALPLPLPLGAALLYDTRLWHRGGANRGRKKARPVWYVTVLGDEGEPPSGLPYTIEPDEVACFRLGPRGLMRARAFGRCAHLGNAERSRAS